MDGAEAGGVAASSFTPSPEATPEEFQPKANANRCQVLVKILAYDVFEQKKLLSFQS